MWGNLQGWIIAAVLFVLIVGGGGYFGVSYSRPTPPTAFGRNPQNLAELKLAVAPGDFVSMTSTGDAGPVYRRAIDDVTQNRKKYAAFLESDKVADGIALPGVKAILEGAPLSSMKLLGQKPQLNIGYHDYATPADLDAIETAGKAVERTGLLLFAQKKPKEAKKYFEAQLALGAKLFNERLQFMEAFKGIGLMNGAAEMLKQMALAEKDTQRVEELEKFIAGTLATTDQLKKVWDIVYAVGGTPAADAKVARHAGDIFYFTTPDMKEKMWRIESTLKLGRFKYNVGGSRGRFADQQGAIARVDEIAQSESDADIKIAAEAARALTLPQFNMIK